MYDGIVPVCETDTNGSVTAVNTWGVKGLLARRTNPNSVFYCFDPQGSASVRLDSGGNVLSSHCNDAWGTQLSTGTGYASDPYAGYGGQWGYYRDSETGLHLLGHRYYDASSGRFLNRDPLGYGGGINMYGYCGSSPIRSIDPSGLINGGDLEFGEGGGSAGGGGGWSSAEEGLAETTFCRGGGGLGGGNWGGSDPIPGEGGTIIADPPAVQPGEMCISGHGVTSPMFGTTTIREGTTINFYCPHGEGISDPLAGLIENYQPMPPGQFCEQFGPGAQIPNYTLLLPNHGGQPLRIFGDPFTAIEPVQLGDILGTNQGTVHWCACRKPLY